MRSTLVFILLLVGAIVAFCLDIALGSVTISWETLLALLTDPSSQPEELSFILWQMRLPNALTAVMCGAGLAVSGLAMQTLFRNPLADASILGVSGGAALCLNPTPTLPRHSQRAMGCALLTPTASCKASA